MRTGNIFFHLYFFLNTVENFLQVYFYFNTQVGTTIYPTTALTTTEAALDYLANEGFDPEMGARPVRRVIEQMVEEPLADALLTKTFKSGDHILIDLEESLDADGDKVSKIVLKAEKPETEEEMPPALIGA